MGGQSHTAGPMTVEYKSGFTIEGNTLIVMNDERYPFAFVPAWDAPRAGEECGAEEAKANARLIAAAPELLEALKTATVLLASANRDRPYYHVSRAVMEARSVIAKATGEASA